MAYGLSDIKAAWDRGVQQGASHVIIMCDTFDWTDYPVFVMPGEDPRDVAAKNGDRVMECYRLSLGWDIQSRERRANHWEMD